MSHTKNDSKRIILTITIIVILGGALTAAVFFIKDVSIPLVILAIINIETGKALMILNGIFSIIGTPLMTFFFFVFLIWFTKKSVNFLSNRIQS